MSKSKITGKVLVIQLGRKETQIVLVGKGTEILHGVTVATPAGAVEDGVIRNPDAIRDMLKTALRASEFKRVRQAVFSVCTSQVITESVSVPALPNAKLEKLLQANMDMYFPVDVQDYHLAWQVIGPKEGEGGMKEVNVQLWAVPIALLKRYYNVGNDCGLSVAAIDYCGHSIASAVGASFARPDKGGRARKKLDLNQPITFGKKKEAAPVLESAAEPRQAMDTELHVLMEQELLGMTFVQNGQVVLQRCIRCGAQPSNQFGELAMMLEYFRSLDIGRGSKIRGIASGIHATDAYMIEELADVLGIPFSRLPVSYDIRWCLCVGAARTDLDFGMPAMNAPGKARSDLQGQLVQYALILAGGLSVLAVVMFILSSRLTWSSELAMLQSEQNILNAQAAKYSGFADNYYTYKNAYDSYSSDWNTVFGKLHFNNDNLVRIMEKLEEMMPENSSVIAMRIGDEGMDVSFACENKEEAAYLIMNLREMKYVSDGQIAFSNLEGGGNGPATTYGSQDKDEEAPPVEGSSTDKTTAAVKTAENIVAALAPKGSLETISLNDLAVLYNAYGKTPAGNNNYSGVIGKDTDELFDVRVAAMNKMFDENPFAMQQLIGTLSSNMDFIQSNGYATDMIMLGFDIFNVEGEIPENLKGARAFKAKYNQVFYQTRTKGQWINSTTRLANTEILLSKDSKLSQAYSYYLSVVENPANAVDFPYLKVDAIKTDLTNLGKLSTQKESLDKKLNELVYEEPVQPSVPETTEPGTDTPDPSVPETTIPGPSVPETSTPETSEPEFTEPDLGDSNLETVKLWLRMYLLMGGSGNEKIDEQLEKYLETGETDFPELTKKIEELIESGELNAEIEKMINDFILGLDKDSPLYELLEDVLDGDNKVEIPEVLFEKIKEILAEMGVTIPTLPEESDPTETTDGTEATGPSGTDDPTESTGGDEKEELEDLSKASAELVLQWLRTYILKGEIGVTDIENAAEEEIAKYFQYGDKLKGDLTEMVQALIDGEYVDNEMKERVKLYIYHRSESAAVDKALHGALVRYFEADGSCGIPVMDDCIKRCLNKIANEVLGSYVGGGSGEDGEDAKAPAAGAAPYVDPRVKFTAFIIYGDQMGKTELERKGLSEDDKLPELFTNLEEGEN